jgi:hypothetical protein
VAVIKISSKKSIDLSDGTKLVFLDCLSVENLKEIKQVYDNSHTTENPLYNIIIIMVTDTEIIDYIINKFSNGSGEIKNTDSQQDYKPYKLRQYEYILYSLCSINQYQKNISNKKNPLDLNKCIADIKSDITYICKNNITLKINNHDTINELLLSINLYFNQW